MRIFLIAFCLALTAGSGFAAKDSAPKQIGKFGDWTAYVMRQKGKQVCYMASFPKKSEGKYKRRGPVYLLVTHRPRDNNFHVVSFQAGYPFSPKAIVKASVTGKNAKQFELFTDDNETAWAPQGDDEKVATAMSRGANLVVFGKSRKGTDTKDRFSLGGFTAAWRAINRKCGAK